jgi:hypothetical protein
MLTPVSRYIENQLDVILESVIEQPKEKSPLQQWIESAKERISNVVALVLYVFVVAVTVYMVYLAIPPPESGSLRHSLQGIRLPPLIWILGVGAVLVTGVRLLQLIGQVVKTYQLLFFIGLWTVGSKLVETAQKVFGATSVESVFAVMKESLPDVAKDILTL